MVFVFCSVSSFFFLPLYFGARLQTAVHSLADVKEQSQGVWRNRHYIKRLPINALFFLGLETENASFCFLPKISSSRSICQSDARRKRVRRRLEKTTRHDCRRRIKLSLCCMPQIFPFIAALSEQLKCCFMLRSSCQLFIVGYTKETDCYWELELDSELINILQCVLGRKKEIHTTSMISHFKSLY